MDNAFRNETLKEFEQFLKNEIQRRKSLYQKYLRYATTVSALNYTLLALDFALGTTGVTLASTGVLVVPGLILSGISSSFAILNMICSAVVKKLLHKVEKNKTIEDLANIKLTALYSQISKSLDDYFVSDSEFSEIRDEMEKHQNATEEIRRKHASNKQAGLIEGITAQFKVKQ